MKKFYNIKSKIISFAFLIFYSLPINALNRLELMHAEPIGMAADEKNLWTLESAKWTNDFGFSNCIIAYPKEYKDKSFSKGNLDVILFRFEKHIQPLDLAVSKSYIWLTCKENSSSTYLYAYRKADVLQSNQLLAMTSYRSPDMKCELSDSPKYIRYFGGQLFMSFVDSDTITSYDEEEVIAQQSLSAVSTKTYKCPNSGRFRLFDKELWICREDKAQIDVYNLEIEKRTNKIQLKSSPSDIALTGPHAYVRYKNISVENGASEFGHDLVSVFDRRRRKCMADIDLSKTDKKYFGSKHRRLEVFNGALGAPASVLRDDQIESLASAAIMVPLFLDTRRPKGDPLKVEGNSLMVEHLRTRLDKWRQLNQSQPLQEREIAFKLKEEELTNSSGLFLRLPSELFDEILSYLPREDQKSLLLTSKYFHNELKLRALFKMRQLFYEWMTQSLYEINGKSEKDSEEKSDVFGGIMRFLYSAAKPISLNDQ